MSLSHTASPRPAGLNFGAILGRVFVYCLLLLATAAALTPFLWLVAATLKQSGEMFSTPFFSHPAKWTGENFTKLFTTEPFLLWLMNSVFISTTTVCLQLFLSSLAGFALAKYEFKGRNFILGLMIATLLIPGQVTLAPSYDLLYRMGLVDTYLGLLIPGAVSVFGIFLFRQSIMQVPDELIHAARIDGCTEFQIYRDVVIPVSRPMIGAFCLLSFMGSWNSFLWPQILLHSKEHYTLPIGLNQMIGLYGNEYGMLMAGTFLSVLPVIVLFFALQKEFVAGLTAGAVKG